jgi:hypothetical protein
LVISYALNEKVFLHAGYQVFGMDYEESGEASRIKFDGVLHGPLLGATFKF